MSINPSVADPTLLPDLNEDEVAIISFCRMLHLDKEEALKRLSIPSSSVIHLHGPELAANLQMAADVLAQSEADPIALSGHDDLT